MERDIHARHLPTWRIDCFLFTNQEGLICSLAYKCHIQQTLSIGEAQMNGHALAAPQILKSAMHGLHKSRPHRSLLPSIRRHKGDGEERPFCATVCYAAPEGAADVARTLCLVAHRPQLHDLVVCRPRIDSLKPCTQNSLLRQKWDLPARQHVM